MNELTGGALVAAIVAGVLIVAFAIALLTYDEVKAKKETEIKED